MIESACVLLVVIVTILVTDGHRGTPRLLWPITNGAMLSVTAAVFFWALVPRAGDVVRTPITAATIAMVILVIGNLIVERRRRGWSN
jgi:hypothetical protein